MQIVIELPDETYKDIKEENGIYGINNGLSARITGEVVGAIQNGTPLLEERRTETEWIPVSERLPKESGKYFVTFGGTYLTGEDFYTTEEDARKTFEEPEEYIGWQSHNVIAWMPLPKPYKIESEETNYEK